MYFSCKLSSSLVQNILTVTVEHHRLFNDGKAPICFKFNSTFNHKCNIYSVTVAVA